MMMHDDAHPLTEVPDPVPDPQSDAGRREWLGLAVLALPTLLLSLDISVLYLALPHLSADLGADSTEQLWIMDVYTFMLAGFLITMGGLGDRIGRRKLLLIGATAFGVASAVAAYATSPEMLIATRALMGIAGATLMPSTLALITNMFANVQQRARAIGVWASCMMVGAAIGPVVGGVLLDAFWWGSVFLMGVPVMVLLLVVAPVLLPEFRETSAGAVDPTSVALSLITILAVVYGLKEIAHTGVQALPVAAIAVGLIVAAIFARRQRRLTNPLLDLRLFRNRSLSIALGIIVVGGVLLSGIFLLISQHLQLVNGLTASAAGLWLAPVGLSVALGAMTAPSIARRMHPGHVIAAGLALSAIGCLLLTLVDSTGGLSLLVAGIIVVYLGVGPAMALGVDLVVGSAPPEKAGVTSATSESATELGAALGIALVGSLATAIYRGQLVVPVDVPAEMTAAARESISGATDAAADLPPGVATQLLDSAREAFSSGLNTTAVVGTVIFGALAAAALTLRRPVEVQMAPADGSDIADSRLTLTG